MSQLKSQLKGSSLENLLPETSTVKLPTPTAMRERARLIRQLKTNKMWAASIELNPTTQETKALLAMLDSAESKWTNPYRVEILLRKLASEIENQDMLDYLRNVEGKAFPEIMPLAYFTMWHERETRYPPIDEKDYWDPRKYTGDCGLVILYPRLYKHAERLCDGALVGAQAAIRMH